MKKQLALQEELGFAEFNTRFGKLRGIELETVIIKESDNLPFSSKIEHGLVPAILGKEYWANIQKVEGLNSKNFIDMVINDTENYIKGTNNLNPVRGNLTHLEDLHINITDKDLSSRAQSVPDNIRTKYSDLANASESLRQFLLNNQTLIEDWLESSTPGSRFESSIPVEMDKPIGYGYIYKNGVLIKLDGLTKGLFILEKQTNSSFIPITGYPVE